MCIYNYTLRALDSRCGRAGPGPGGCRGAQAASNMFTHTPMCVYACVYVYIYIYICIYTHTYTYICA